MRTISRHITTLTATGALLALLFGDRATSSNRPVVSIERAARAGTPVDQGSPGTQGPWPVASGKCITPTPSVTSVGVTAVSCPSSQLAGRKYIFMCNSPENGGTPKIKIRIDGTSPVMGVANPGDVLAVGDCIAYWIPSTVTPKCISDTAATALTADECLQ